MVVYWVIEGFLLITALSLKILITVQKELGGVDHLDVTSRLCADKVGFVKYKIRLASV